MSLNVQRASPIPILLNGRWRQKRVESEEPVTKCPRLSDSPPDSTDLPSPGSPGPTPGSSPFSSQGAARIGNYILLQSLERHNVFRAISSHTGQEYVCKVFDIKSYRDEIGPYLQLPAHKNITGIEEIILGEKKCYVFLEKGHGDMHLYMRSCKRLGEEEAAQLFEQIVSAVAHCHDSGIVLRDLKLRKFVFSDEQRRRLRLESLVDAHILKGKDDSLSDKHGCPAYVSPEILNTSGCYSGKAADVWSLGVMLYTLLVGRYPFHDSDPSALFSKIRRGQFCIPDSISPKAKCLIRSLLRRDPAERLTAGEILLHPWFRAASEQVSVDQEDLSSDQTVPEFDCDQQDASSFFC
ncbi:tribbles homolog 1 [Callorhinchus milii]|uniref:Tribbles pseudokinase 1 n=1 Tax=Callorhinchus milii TaxID=7868 RepID=A0A4W3JAJ5_CALMI|nr:tribbles homolog 1 [Callorhinchus milii]|eukprot:gi/632970434/ref/XP_007901647.1/ PREDICTED: tribbles homolog 1 [Callorhinchus milii]